MSCKIAIVTGGSRVLGKKIAFGFAKKGIAGQTALGRVGLPDDTGGVIAWLLSATIARSMRNGSGHPAAWSSKQMIKMNYPLLNTTSVGSSDVLLKYSAFRPLSSHSKDL